MWPQRPSVEFGLLAELGLALLLGVGSGFALERAGLGSARKLTAVFYLWDMVAVKVMFTAIVTAMATGRRDGMLFVAGMLAGVMAYAEFTPGIERWIRAGSRGETTLPSVTGIGMGRWVLAFVAFLVVAGWGMGRLERRFAHLRPRG
jgi:hypothetical protein